MADDTLRTFMDRPLDFFEESLTKMHSIGRASWRSCSGRQ
jgi:hypothetical protein